MIFADKITEYLDEYKRTGDSSNLSSALDFAERSKSKAHILFVKGAIKFDEGKFEEAEKYYREVLSIAPTFQGAKTNLCLALLRQKTNPKFEEVITVANKYLVGFLTEDSQIHNLKAMALFNLGKFEEAVSTAYFAIVADHKYVTAYRSYILSQLALGNQELAKSIIGYYEMKEGDKNYLLKKLIPDLFDIANELLVDDELTIEKKVEIAVSTYKFIIELDEKFGGAWYNLAMSYMYGLEIANAQKAFEKALPNVEQKYRKRVERYLEIINSEDGIEGKLVEELLDELLENKNKNND